MMVVSMLLYLVLAPVWTAATLPPPDRSCNILMILPLPFPSHRNVFLPLATALAERGHRVTMLNNLPAPDTNPNITYINHGLPVPELVNIFENRHDIFKTLINGSDFYDNVISNLYDVPVVMELYNKRQAFDLVIFDHFFAEVGYPFVHNKPMMTVATPGLDNMQSAVMGNLQNPAYVSSLYADAVHPMTYSERLSNILVSLAFPYYWRNVRPIPAVAAMFAKRFPDLPPVSEIERNISLTLMNDNFMMRSPYPLLPSQVEIGGIHCTPAKPLPKNIAEFIGDDPVIYFSLGSIIPGEMIPLEYQKIIVQTFASLPYKILWKYEGSRADTSENVLIQKWLPQQDILAHPNVKLFVSHCGQLSSIEAMCHGTPILGLPILSDQPKNARILKRLGVAEILVWEELTVRSFRTAIQNMVQKQSYLSQAIAHSRRFRDQPQSPVDKAVYWTEYVIRHGGAKHLRSPEMDLSWVQLLHLDIIFMIYMLIYVAYRIMKKLWRVCCGLEKTGKKQKRE